MQREGMDLDSALAALSTVSAWAPVAGYLTTLMRKGDHAPQFPVALLRKDMDYTLQVGPAEALPLIAALRDQLDAAIAAGLGEDNMTAVVRLGAG